MGIVFGIVGVEEPAFRVLAQRTRFEVRVLPPAIAATVRQHMGDGGNGAAFPVLARYIGVMSATPNNAKSEAIAMTAPVVQCPLTDEAKAATTQTGYGTGDMSMTFLLPASFTMDSAPEPLDPRIELREQAARLIAVKRFSGWVNERALKGQLDELIALTTDAGLRATDEEIEWELAQYNPPFTVPFLRRNEVWLTLHKTEDEVKAALEAETAIAP